MYVDSKKNCEFKQKRRRNRRNDNVSNNDVREIMQQDKCEKREKTTPPRDDNTIKIDAVLMS